jgi:hypothetical protein
LYHSTEWPQAIRHVYAALRSVTFLNRSMPGLSSLFFFRKIVSGALNASTVVVGALNLVNQGAALFLTGLVSWRLAVVGHSASRPQLSNRNAS